MTQSEMALKAKDRLHEQGVGAPYIRAVGMWIARRAPEDLAEPDGRWLLVVGDSVTLMEPAEVAEGLSLHQWAPVVLLPLAWLLQAG